MGMALDFGLGSAVGSILKYARKRDFILTQTSALIFSHIDKMIAVCHKQRKAQRTMKLALPIFYQRYEWYSGWWVFGYIYCWLQNWSFEAIVNPFSIGKVDLGLDCTTIQQPKENHLIPEWLFCWFLFDYNKTIFLNCIYWLCYQALDD